MAVPNPNQITSTLRMMPDAQLQQYAAMHKNDPYIFPMAFAESNARKQARAAQQAQGMGQQQPKVVDQDLMEMGAPPPQMAPQGMPPRGGPQMAQQQLPEDSGIGALPAPNMQRMADGGIAGYADDNEFNYSGADDSVVMMAGGGVAHFQQGGQSIMRNTTPYGGMMGDIPGYVPGDTSGMPQVGAAENLPFIQRKTREAAEAVQDDTATPQQKALVNWANRLGFGTPELGPKTAMPTQSPESDWPASKPARNQPPPPPNPKNKPPALQPTAPATPALQPTAPATPAEKAPTGADLIAQAISGSKTLNDESAAAFKPYHDQLNKENEEILGRKADNRAYALLAAGLGMMGGTSQYAAQNIAAGGIKGLATFQEAEKADAAARKANQQSQMLLMQAERAERSGNMKVAGDMQSRAEQARQFGITAEQHAETLKETKNYHKGVLANDDIRARAAMWSAQRPLGGGGAEDKHMVALAKVQSVLNSNPVYKEAAKNASMPGTIGVTARATVEQIERATYSRFAPELLQSGQGSPSGSGGGVNISQWGKPQVIKP